MHRPNIVLIAADDQQHDTIHALGNEVIRTPVLDSLVRRGTSFTRTYVSGGLTPAVCVPSRACLHTGDHSLRACAGRELNVWPGLMSMSPRHRLLGEAFRESGYTTFATGKWHNDRASFVRSFSRGDAIFFGGMSEHDRVPVYDFDPEGEYRKESRRRGQGFSTDIFTDAAAAFLGSYRDEAPFFLYLAYTAPHDPRTAPKPFSELYDPNEIPLPANFMERHPFDNGEMNVRDELLEAIPRDPAAVRRHIAEYYAMVSHLDDRVGRVLHALEDNDRLGDTIVVFTGDHGLALGRHGLMGKQNLYDHSVRVPLVMAGPGIAAGLRVDALTGQPDIFPTLCELCGVTVPDSVSGESLLPLLREPHGIVHDSVFAVYKDLQRMVCDGEWKLIRYYRPEEHNYGTDRVQLFHVSVDPHEIDDLSGDPGARQHLDRLATELRAWQERLGDPWAYRPLLPPVRHEGVWGNWND